jgi:hypothetical protein
MGKNQFFILSCVFQIIKSPLLFFNTKEETNNCLYNIFREALMAYMEQVCKIYITFLYLYNLYNKIDTQDI